MTEKNELSSVLDHFFVNESAIKFALGYINSTFFLQAAISILNLLVIGFIRVSWLLS